jgi:hypothetical protein
MRRAATIEQAKRQLVSDTLPGALRDFMPQAQRMVLLELLKGEEGEAIAELVIEVAKVVEDMPITYQQEGLGMEAIVHLHYFRGSADAFICEKDVKWPQADEDFDQSFGWVSLFADKARGEFGYASIREMVQAGMELDLHWTPKTVAEAIRG